MGRRLETTVYDMPRVIDLTTQSALLDDVVNADDSDGISQENDVTVEDLANFINSRGMRPSPFGGDVCLPAGAVDTESGAPPF